MKIEHSVKLILSEEEKKTLWSAYEILNQSHNLYEDAGIEEDNDETLESIGMAWRYLNELRGDIF